MVTEAVVPVDLDGIEADAPRAVRAARTERRRPVEAAGTRNVEIGIDQVTCGGKEYPIICVTGLL